MEAVHADGDPTIVEELNAALYGSSVDGRLSVEHLKRRDYALTRIDSAIESVERLEEVERGPSQGSQSPRHHEVREILADLRRARRRLDGVYV